MSAWSTNATTVAMLPNGGYGTKSVQTVPACSVQIKAHHHRDVHTDINNVMFVFTVKPTDLWDFLTGKIRTQCI